MPVDLASVDPALDELRTLSQAYVGSSFEADTNNLLATQALVANNVFRSGEQDVLPSFYIQLPEGRLLLNGNSCHLGHAEWLGQIVDTRYVVVTNNLFDAPQAGLPLLLIYAANTTNLIVTSNLSTNGNPIQIIGAPVELRKANNIPTI